MNALQRKANRSDIDQLLELKADIADLDKVCNVLETKFDQRMFEEAFARQFNEENGFASKNDIARIAQ